jgi:hypothetical protein
MNDSTRIKAVSAGYSSLASWTPAYTAAFFEKLWASGIVYGPVHPSTSKKRLIRGIHDRINNEIGDVSADGMYPSSHVT